MEGAQTQTIALRIDKPTLAKVRAFAKQRGVTVSALIRELLGNLVGDRRPRPRRSKTSRS